MLFRSALFQDLLSPNCPIRYIITVNALKEGWDCPFAYILASLANKTSQVDVEQILGRILRLPHTTQHSQHALNLSYVLTSSNDFDETVKQIVKGRPLTICFTVSSKSLEEVST